MCSINPEKNKNPYASNKGKQNNALCRTTDQVTSLQSYLKGELVTKLEGEKKRKEKEE
jgi:hypothetical protein